MTEQLERFITLLKGIFELDKSDLDFGIYRIMNIRKKEIEKFLEEGLPARVKDALASFAANTADIEKRIAEIETQCDNVGIEVAQSKMAEEYKQLKASLAKGIDHSGLEADVYSQLYSFFNRYYEEGDFISKRRYKEGVYAIPYEGEEVKLYWANQDQYYIKTSENFKDYTFVADGYNIHFRLVDATTEQNNNKESKDNKRVFMLYTEDPERPDLKTFEFDAEKKELIIRFVFDIPEDKKAKYEELNDKAITTWLIGNCQELVTVLLVNVSTDPKKKQNLLQKHLRSYVAKNTFDYFIHKDLKKFLSRELDFFIKNEVMHLDDVDTTDEKRVDTWLAKVRAIKRVGKVIIDFLASIEDFQKKLWLKKKFVVQCDYCITLDRIPSRFHKEIWANEKQLREWQSLGFISDLNWDYSNANFKFNNEWYEVRLQEDSVEIVKLPETKANEYPLLPESANEVFSYFLIDTKLFDNKFKETLLGDIENLNVQCNGEMFYGDNYNVLRLIQKKYCSQIQCVYIDPPFNTGSDGFCYKDGYNHSSWMSMMEDRCHASLPLLKDSGSFYSQIDYFEKERLKLILDNFLHYQTEIIWRIGWLSGYKTKAKKFIRNHDTIYQYSKSETPLFNKIYIPYPEGYVRRDGNPPDGEGYPLEDTWNCYEIDRLDSIQIMSFCKEKVGDASATQKNEALLERILLSSTNKDDIVLDFFAGTGTTQAVAFKMGRKFITSEMSHRQFFQNELPRIKRCLNGDKYGISSKYNYPAGGMIKYCCLENYEDALSNVVLPDDDNLNRFTSLFGEEYLIKYMLDLDTAGSVLNLAAFNDPFDYKLKVTEKNETKEVNADLMETFNYLIGLTVDKMYARKIFSASPDPAGEYDGAVKLIGNDNGEYIFRQIEGTLPSGERALIIWRNITDNLLESNAALDAYFQRYRINPADREFDVIFVNGDNNIANLKNTEETWKVRMIEPEFKSRMFEEE